ncbi:unnamed protein product [Rodentolepis nana]|uniref:Secreted protein n=1 Tax=Rodentolepis nana TaxID=102285 RepID=A0A0R3TZM4_RODNA|nr:unnamed protein product [Rodentolepis nana]
MRAKFVIVSLLLLYLIGWSFGASLNRPSEGDIADVVDGVVGASPNGKVNLRGPSKGGVVRTPRGIVDVRGLPLTPPPRMEMGCSCICGPVMAVECNICDVCDPNMFVGQGNGVVSEFELIKRTLPHIPVEYANWLIYMDQWTVNFVIRHHYDLPSLIIHAQADTLAHIISNVPDFSEMLAQMHPNVILTVFQRMPYPCKYLQGIRREAAEMIVNKMVGLSHCLPTTTTPTWTTTTATPTPTTTTTTTPTTSTPAPGARSTTATVSKAPVDVLSLFKKEELDYMTAKVPRIKALLAKAVPEAVRISRIIHSNLKVLVDDLSEDFLEFLNTPGLAKLKTSTIHAILKILGEDDLAINALADLFA